MQENIIKSRSINVLSKKRITFFALSFFALIIVGGFGAAVVKAADTELSRVEQGKQLAFNRRKGNCLACHIIADGDLPGNIAPPLIAMKPRFPDYERLLEQIRNPLSANPNSVMPPFGLHNILSEDEVNMVAEYLYTL